MSEIASRALEEIIDVEYIELQMQLLKKAWEFELKQLVNSVALGEIAKIISH